MHILGRRICQIGVGTLLTTLIIGSGQVYAGTIPPGQSPGGSIAPGELSPSNAGLGSNNNVGGAQVVSTTVASIALLSQNVRVVIDALPGDVTLPGANVGDLVQARISSAFTLRNTDKEAIHGTLVQLPLSDLSGLKDGKGQLMEAQDFVIEVDGNVVSPTVVEQTNPLGTSEPAVKWVQFPMTLTAGQSAVVSTTYVAPAAGALPLAQFNYALETAGPWQGKLGQSTVTVELPYPANRQNVMTSDDETSVGARLNGNTIVWTRRNFEPSLRDNLKLMILAPQVWTNIENARAAVKQAPDDPQAHLALARAYKAALLMDNGVAQGSTAQFVPLAIEAYKKAIKASPDSPDLHSQYAKFLADTQIAGALNTRKAVAMLDTILDEVETTLKLDPKNATALGLLANVKQLATDVTQRDPSAAASKLVGRVDALAQSVGLTSAQALATAMAQLTSTVAADNLPTIAETGTITATGAITGEGNVDTSTAVSVGTDVSNAVTTGMAATGTVTTANTATTGNSITRLSSMGLPQTILMLACGALSVIGVIAALLIVLFRRQNRSDKSGKV